ncbi:MAG: 3-phosphoglycerate dehydrogenase [Gammaproteobacteria bacterium]|jgi:D-3-phosphoglycerate dehydrogenase|uniref:phosphoglycerate dehydrogenase n=1 Tax=marine metagenome TaxID=408172 RepID=A0A381RNS4_9ZZZZ|nr:3-phosphoglycerate dehydrogenase [Gammaproteobacteria bacterium]MED5556301.1 3-phosphoglycerate dehydrogenase family protein [Pseudomonadota bacterium]MEE3133636.1 3-phosphoglycerate dehydrogenase family protein [Pseudomonadota bacterium]|tara:strand:- start:3619 stop:4803 length:1185 start_codon:yes stop_codon:yes gene_type:complete
MYRIRTFDNIAERGIAAFAADKFQVDEDLKSPHAILLRSHNLTIDELDTYVAAVARAGAGVNNIPVDVCTERGIVVFNTPGANANSVKEIVLAALLLSVRDIVGGMRFVRTLQDVKEEIDVGAKVELEKRRFRGRELTGRTLGVVGLGSVGSLVAKAALDLGMDVVGYDPALSIDAAWRLPSAVVRMENLSSLFSRSELVSLHVPANPETSSMINAETLASFRPGTALLNFAREEIVDVPAVVNALDTGILSYYFTDFPSSLLSGHERAHAMPHLGASTTEAEENCAVMAARQLDTFLRYGNIENSVNFPTISMEPSEGHRIGISNKNVAGSLGELLSVLADRQINVIDLINKSRGEIAYNLIDIADPPSEPMLSDLLAIETVIGVRAMPNELV